MAKRVSAKDQFVQFASVDIVESAANTLAFSQLQTGQQLFERRALVIHRADIYLSRQAINLLLDASDRIDVGLSTSNSITDIELNNPNVVFKKRYNLMDFGTPANTLLVEFPDVMDFSTLPMGGLIVPAFPIFGFAQGTSLASAISASRMRLYFTVRELAPTDYIELVEAMRIIT